jgi:hypothetical protein
VAGAWPEGTTDVTVKFHRREAAAEALRCESSKNATRLARAFNEIPVVEGEDRDYRSMYLENIVIDNALREKAPSDHALLVSLGALVSAHMASTRRQEGDSFHFFGHACTSRGMAHKTTIVTTNETITETCTSCLAR